jgi:hypothetical protein
MSVNTIRRDLTTLVRQCDEVIRQSDRGNYRPLEGRGRLDSEFGRIKYNISINREAKRDRVITGTFNDAKIRLRRIKCDYISHHDYITPVARTAVKAGATAAATGFFGSLFGGRAAAAAATTAVASGARAMKGKAKLACGWPGVPHIPFILPPEIDMTGEMNYYYQQRSDEREKELRESQCPREKDSDDEKGGVCLIM